VTIRVVLADDQPLVRAGFKVLIDATNDIKVVAEGSTGREAVDAVRRTHPDVVLMDIRMPETDGLAATRIIAADETLADVRILILTTFEIDEYVFAALRAGASGFLGKGAEPAELLEAIRTIARGDSLLSPVATASLIGNFLATPERSAMPVPEQLSALTAREREVLALVAGGLSNEEIADRLVVSPATAKTHVNRSMTKLGARDRAQLVVIAFETGLVRTGGIFHQEPPS
jgi:DNA-binding NarL/FixJ family response regulator